MLFGGVYEQQDIHNTQVANSGGLAKEELPGSCNFAKLNICPFNRKAVVNKACILKCIVDIGCVESGMNQDFSGNVFDNTVMTFTDAILVMFRSGISSSDFLFGCPSFENGRFEFSTSIRMNVLNCVWSKLGVVVSDKMS